MTPVQKMNQQLTKYPGNRNQLTEANQILLDKSVPNKYSTFQIDGSFQKQAELNTKQQYLNDQQQKCYPKCLSWIGKCIAPFLVLCPCFRCARCCQNLPLFEQPMQSYGILQKWGSYQKLLNPGLHVINPVSQKIVQINRQTKTLQISQIAFTKDNVQFRVDSIIFYRIVDSLKLAYKLGIGESQCRQCVAQIAQACLRSLVGSNTLQNVIQKRQLVANRLRQDLNNNLEVWGIYIQTCSLKELILSPDIKQYLQSAAKAKRNMEAQIINYKAQVEVGKLIKQVSQILSTNSAFQIRYLDTIANIIQRNGNSVIMIKTQIQHKQ